MCGDGASGAASFATIRKGEGRAYNAYKRKRVETQRDIVAYLNKVGGADNVTAIVGGAARLGNAGTFPICAALWRMQKRGIVAHVTYDGESGRWLFEMKDDGVQIDEALKAVEAAAKRHPRASSFWVLL